MRLLALGLVQRQRQRVDQRQHPRQRRAQLVRHAGREQPPRIPVVGLGALVGQHHDAAARAAVGVGAQVRVEAPSLRLVRRSRRTGAAAGRPAHRGRPWRSPGRRRWRPPRGRGWPPVLALLARTRRPPASNSITGVGEASMMASRSASAHPARRARCDPGWPPEPPLQIAVAAEQRQRPAPLALPMHERGRPPPPAAPPARSRGPPCGQPNSDGRYALCHAH